MVSNKNDPIFNPIRAVKEALSPLESGIRKAAKDLEACWAPSPGKTNVDCVIGDDNVAAFSVNERFWLVKELKSGFSDDGSDKVQIFGVKKKDSVGSEEKKKGSVFFKVPVRALFGMFSPPSLDVGVVKREERMKGLSREDGSCSNCLRVAVTWSVLFNGFVQSVSSPFRWNGKKGVKKMNEGKRGCVHLCEHGSKAKVPSGVKKMERKGITHCENGEEGKHISVECLIGFLFDQLALSLQKFEQSMQKIDNKGNDGDCDCLAPSDKYSQVDHLRGVMSIWESRKLDFNGFLGNLKFARVGGVPSGMVGVSSPVNEGSEDGVADGGSEDTGGVSPQKLASGILSIPLSNVERLKSTLSNVSLAELAELLPYLGRSSKDYPDKKKLFSVQDFFRYTEAEGRRFFEELDRDGDGQVTQEDLELAMKRRKLPRRYARDFMQRARSHLFAKSFGWKQFLTLMEQREPTILRAYTSLCLTKSGTLQKSEILASLKNAGLPANDDNAVAMMRFLNADTEESIAYGHFRNFMLLLPSDRLQDDPRSIWFEAATVVAVPPAVEIPAGSVLRSALAGGLSCALSCCLMHPVDTIKTRVQASSLSFPEIISKLPQIGVRGLYRGSLPAIWGQFTSHGLRTGIFEASKLVLINVAPTLPELQVQSVSSFCSTFLGTAVRIPCEVLKQRLQAGIFNNVGEAIVCTWQQDGLRGFFRGTGATLFREVPFYVAGMGLYAESKKAVQHLLRRELEPWETIMVGALSGGLAAVVTTPFDVMKTRMMTAQGRHIPMSLVAISILRREGPLGLFKGAIPRFFWIAPLGAMNFAGYELARKAIHGQNEEPVTDQLPQNQKKPSST